MGDDAGPNWTDDIIKFGQFGLKSDPTKFVTNLVNSANLQVAFPIEALNSTVLLKLKTKKPQNEPANNPEIETIIETTVFKEGEEPIVTSSNFKGQIVDDFAPILLGLNKTQSDQLFDSYEGTDKSKFDIKNQNDFRIAFLSIITIKEGSTDLTKVIYIGCTNKTTKLKTTDKLTVQPLYCSKLLLNQINYQYQSIQLLSSSLQIFDTQKYFHNYPFDRKKSQTHTKIKSEGSFTKALFFKGRYFCILNNNLVSLKSENDTEIQVFENPTQRVYTNLHVTKSYLLANYYVEKIDQSSKKSVQIGIEVITESQEGFFGKSEESLQNNEGRQSGKFYRLKKRVLENDQVETVKETNQKAPNRFTKDDSDDEMSFLTLDYPLSSSGFNKIKFFEWEGNLITFDKDSMYLMTIPPTITNPPKFDLIYQVNGQLNSSYIQNGESIDYVVPIPAKTTSLGLIRSPAKTNSDSSTSQTLYLNRVEMDSPVLNFEKLSSEALLEMKSFSLTIFYSKYPKFISQKYTVSFVHSKKINYLLIIPVALLGLLVLVSLIFCCCKFKKAMKKEKQNSKARKESLGNGEYRKYSNRYSSSDCGDLYQDDCIPNRLREPHWQDDSVSED